MESYFAIFFVVLVILLFVLWFLYCVLDLVLIHRQKMESIRVQLELETRRMENHQDAG